MSRYIFKHEYADRWFYEEDYETILDDADLEEYADEFGISIEEARYHVEEITDSDTEEAKRWLHDLRDEDGNLDADTCELFCVFAHFSRFARHGINKYGEIIDEDEAEETVKKALNVLGLSEI